MSTLLLVRLKSSCLESLLTFLVSGSAENPLFHLYKDVFCQKDFCLACVSGQGKTPNCVHRDCYVFYKHFFPKSPLRLQGLLQLWPDTVDFAYQNSERQQHAYSKYIAHLKQDLACSILQKSSTNLRQFTNLLRLMAQILPPELLCRIAELSWPCALQKPVTILAENNSLLQFSKRKEHNTVTIIEYRGEPVFVTKVAFLGSSYVTGLSIDRKSTVHRRGGLRIAVVRDNLGITDIDFNWKFSSSRQVLWYKVISTGVDHLKLRVCIMVCVMLG